MAYTFDDICKDIENLETERQQLLASGSTKDRIAAKRRQYAIEELEDFAIFQLEEQEIQQAKRPAGFLAVW